MVNRKEYLEKLIDMREKQAIKVVTGVRRCGKSTLFSMYIDYLKSTNITDEQIISVNLEDIEFEDLLDYKSLYNYIKKRLCKDKFSYVFIDEVQNCKGFEKAVDSLFIKENVDVYITGSNAYMLSGELATLLSGRYITVDMLPLSFKEYCILEQSKKSLHGKFNDYLRFGSFPYVATLKRTDDAVSPYIEGIYNTILIKDVAKREGINDVSLLEDIVKCVASSIGSPISAKKIADTLISSGRSISSATVERYLRALTDSYFFHKVNRYDIRGRAHLKTLGKYYMVDTGIRNLISPSASSDIGHIIENTVYLELLRRNYKVSIGKIVDKEVDFVATNMQGVNYFQVSASVLDEKTKLREIEPLQAIKDHYPKILLTLDEIGADSNYEGIKQMNLIDWLMMD